MKDPGEEGGVVRCRGIELAGEETDIHLQVGKQVFHLDAQIHFYRCAESIRKQAKGQAQQAGFQRTRGNDLALWCRSKAIVCAIQGKRRLYE